MGGLAAGLLALSAGNALSLPGRLTLGHYDFGYASQGDARVRPLQVFTDGRGRVFFQFHPGDPPPAIFAGAEDPTLLMVEPAGPYLSARTEAAQFTLVLGSARAVVQRADLAGLLAAEADRGAPGVVAEQAAAVPGGPVLPAVAEDAAAGRWHEQPLLFRPGLALATGELQAALLALASRIGAADDIQVELNPEQGQPASLLLARGAQVRQLLVSRGIAPGRIHVRDAAPLPAPAAADAQQPRVAATVRWGAGPAPGVRPAMAADPAWVLQADDRDVAGSLRRWGRAAGYEVVWDSPLRAPLTGSLPLPATGFLDAVQQVMQGLRAQGYPVQVQVQADAGRVLHVVDLR